MAQTQTLDKLFIDELEDIYSSENQILEVTPKFLKLVTSPELKEALMKFTKERQMQVTRLEKIFSLLNISSKEKFCLGMDGILKGADTLVQNKTKSASLDAAIICETQKIKHYEIATYGTLRSFAKFLDFDHEIIDLIQKTLDEKESADTTLTKIAEGSLFSSGVNKEAAAKHAKR